jgi:hypothetical protein
MLSPKIFIFIGDAPTVAPTLSAHRKPNTRSYHRLSKLGLLGMPTAPSQTVELSWRVFGMAARLLPP